MNKPSEALECLEIVGCLITKETEKGYIMLKEDKEFEKEYNIIKQALIELQQIKNDKPSEALEYLEHIMQNDFNMMIATYPPIPAYNGITKNEMFNTIKQALLSKQISVENSEAMKCLEKLELLTCDFEWYKDNINTIKQALIQGITDSACLDELQDKYYELKQTKSKKEMAFDVIKPLCEVVETPVRKDRYLKINGVVVYTIKSQEEFELLKRYLCQNE